MRKPVHIAVVVLLCLTSACGGQEAANPTSAVPAATQPTPAATPADSPDAQTIIGKLKNANLGLKNVQVQDEDTDPNNLLGRPNGYASKIAFSDSRVSRDDTVGAAKDAIERGGSIEVYPDSAGAKARATYIQEMLKATGFGAEYDYVKGPILVRVTGNLTPTKAMDYQAALA